MFQTLREKSEFVLMELYQNAYSGQSYYMSEIHGIHPDEARSIANFLQQEGYIEKTNSKNDKSAMITHNGINYIEDLEIENGFFSDDEKEEILNRMNELEDRITELEGDGEEIVKEFARLILKIEDTSKLKWKHDLINFTISYPAAKYLDGFTRGFLEM